MPEPFSSTGANGLTGLAPAIAANARILILGSFLAGRLARRATILCASAQGGVFKLTSDGRLVPKVAT